MISKSLTLSPGMLVVIVCLVGVVSVIVVSAASTSMTAHRASIKVPSQCEIDKNKLENTMTVVSPFAGNLIINASLTTDPPAQVKATSLSDFQSMILNLQPHQLFFSHVLSTIYVNWFYFISNSAVYYLVC